MARKEATLELERREDGVAVLWMDDPGQPVNTLKPALAEAFAAVLDALEDSTAAKALVIASAKPDNFIAGADLDVLRSVESITEGHALADLAQAMHRRLASLPMPVVAAVHGTCLGGGLELALAADARVASRDRATRLGLPEVQLGLLPGGGGTQRLPRLVGLVAALPLLLSGRQLDADEALAIGLVDAAVPREVLIEAAVERALHLRGLHRRAGRPLVPPKTHSPFSRRGLLHLLVARNPIGRQLFFARVHRQVLDRTRGNYPAPERILEVVRTGLEKGRAAGFAAEARAFGELVVSSQSRALVRMFFATRALGKESGVDDPSVVPRAVDRVGLLGAGLMGAGIAYLCAVKAGTAVCIRERDRPSLDAGLDRVRALIDGRVRRKRLSEADADAAVARLSGSLDIASLGSADLVIEAVFEDVELKRGLLSEVESIADAAPMFASNTSSIPISAIARGCRRPANVIGMHYFSPADRMPLLEVVVTAETAPEVVAACVAYGKRQGKTVIVVRDGPGFYTSRILAPYLNEAAWLLGEGVAIDVVDRALVDFGFPIGPLALLDEVGIDVAGKVSAILEEAFGERIRPPPGLGTLVDSGNLGAKTGRGFYVHEGRSRRRVDDTVYDRLGVEPRRKPDAVAAPAAPAAIAERCVLQMVNEAARCLESNVLACARDGDVGAVFGLGFPPFLGGPFRYADAIGAAALVERLERLADRHGERFHPAGVLRDLAERQASFYDAD